MSIVSIRRSHQTLKNVGGEKPRNGPNGPRWEIAGLHIYIKANKRVEILKITIRWKMGNFGVLWKGLPIYYLLKFCFHCAPFRWCLVFWYPIQAYKSSPHHVTEQSTFWFWRRLCLTDLNLLEFQWKQRWPSEQISTCSKRSTITVSRRRQHYGSRTKRCLFKSLL